MPDLELVARKRAAIASSSPAGNARLLMTNPSRGASTERAVSGSVMSARPADAKGHHNMKRPFRRAALAFVAGIALTLAISTLATGGRASAAGPTTVNLGAAESFAILAGTPDITSTGASVVNGDVGIHPAAVITGFPPGIINGSRHPADALALQAKNSLTAAYLDAASRPVTSVIAAGTLSGTLVGGVYNSGASILSIAGTVTLDGQGDATSVWIFQAQSSMVIASASRVAFINGAQPCNVFWQVTSSASLGSTADLAGTIMAQTSITMANGVTLNGREIGRAHV